MIPCIILQCVSLACNWYLKWVTFGFIPPESKGTHLMIINDNDNDNDK